MTLFRVVLKVEIFVEAESRRAALAVAPTYAVDEVDYNGEEALSVAGLSAISPTAALSSIPVEWRGAIPYGSVQSDERTVAERLAEVQP